MTQGAISKKEWYFVGIFSFAIALLSLAPYLLGVLVQQGDDIFIGTPLIAIGDYRSYLAWIEQASNGELLFYNYSAPPALSSDGILFHPVFLILGLISRIANVSPMTLYHVSSACAAFMLLLTAYRFFAVLTNSVLWRKWSLVLFSSATGLGALLYMPASKFNFPEYSMFVRMHDYLLGSIDSIVTFIIFIIVIERFGHMRRRDGLLLGILLAFLVIVHPYMVITTCATIFVYLVVRKSNMLTRKTLYPLLLAILMMLPAALWQAYALAHDPSFGMWFFSGMLTERYPLSEMLIGYGLVVPLAFLGLLMHRRELFQREYALLVFWSVVMLIGVFQPFFPSVARRLGEVLFIPLIFFAAYPLAHLWEHSRRHRSVVFLVAGILIIGNLFFYVKMLESSLIGTPYERATTTTTPARLDVLHYEERETLSWLRAHVGKHDVVLSGGAMGSIIPIFIDTHVSFGHPSLMPGLMLRPVIVPEVLRHAGPESNAWKRFVRDEPDYIVVDDEVRSFGYVPEHDPCATLVHASAMYPIYRIDHDCSGVH